MTHTRIKSIFSFLLVCGMAAGVACGQKPVVQPAAYPSHIGSLSSFQADQATADHPVPAYESVADYNSYGNAACASGCDSGCELDSPFGFGLIKRSDHCFSDFISPMTNPVFFEDPRSNTEARFIFFDHNVPTAAGGGDVQLYALQLRARLTDYVSLIATKDGYVTSSNPFIDNGWADLAVGLKFNLLRNVCRQRLLSGGFTYELPTGEASAFQGNGDGEFNLFLTGGTRLGSRSHWISAGGLRLPVNDTDESTSAYWSNHLDYRFARRWYVLTELNWYHWLASGQDGPLPGIEGLDVINFGNPGVSGNDIVTNAYGMKFKPNCHNELGFAWEFPLTERRDIIDNRLTVDWIFRY